MQKQIITLRSWNVLEHTMPAGFQSIEFIGGDKYRVTADGSVHIVDGFETVEVNAYAPGEAIIHYTDAPLNYDGFGTQTVKVIRQTRLKRDLRQVLILKPHAEWQIGRYRSGLYVGLDQAKFDDMGDLL